MSDERAFLEAIRAAPRNASLRLAYVDCLAERGDPRCEHVRVEEAMLLLPVYSDDRPLPFQADFVTELAVEPRPGGALLRVTQDDFPTDSSADAYYAGCEVRWRQTFTGIRRFLCPDKAESGTLNT